jgi:endonuclease/exonuclease/phosphatase family metal-dependent hydrolase
MVHVVLASVMSIFPRKLGCNRKISFFSSKHSNLFINDELDWGKQKPDYFTQSKFNVVSFNLLAPCYKRLPIRDALTGYRIRESTKPELWKERVAELRLFLRNEIYNVTEIVAFQEFWLEEQYLSLFREDLEEFGFEIHMLQRTGKKLDAVALMIKKKTFEILESKNIFLCNIGDRVALLLWLRHRSTNKNLLVANTHLSFPHNDLDRLNQMKQMKLLTNTIDQFARTNGIKNATRMVMGDFNVESASPVCDHLRDVGYSSCFEVTTDGNCDAKTGQERSDGQSNEKKKFVSHRTHKCEDLGVDHIFVQPSNHHHHHPSSPLHHHHHHQHVEKTIFETIEYKQSEKKKTTKQHVDDVFEKKNETDVSVKQFRDFVYNGKVLPESLPCDVWHENFAKISDHRPVGATVIFAQKK